MSPLWVVALFGSINRSIDGRIVRATYRYLTRVRPPQLWGSKRHISKQSGDSSASAMRGVAGRWIPNLMTARGQCPDIRHPDYAVSATWAYTLTGQNGICKRSNPSRELKTSNANYTPFAATETT